MTASVMSSGNGELDNKMGGGIPVGSLTLIEGSSGAGKSVLAQQIIWGSLQKGFRLALFTSENTVKSLVTQMRSLDLDVLDFLLLGRLRVYPVELAALGAQGPRVLLQAVKRSPANGILLDSLTSVLAPLPPETCLAFFEECKRMCAGGRTLFLIVHTNALSPEVLVRLRSICDAHLQLRTEDDGKRIIKLLEVTKVRGADSTTGNIVSFDVEPGWGMRVVPVNKVRG